jgi:hypothetical protein
MGIKVDNYQKLLLSSAENYITKYPELIKEIDNPSEELQILALRKDGGLIDFIKNPTGEMIRIALSRGHIPNNINDLDDELKMLSIKAVPQTIETIKKPTEEMIICAIEHGHFLGVKKINSLNYKLKEIYIKQHPEQIRHIIKPSQKLIKIALSLRHYLLDDVDSSKLSINFKLKCKPNLILKIKNPTNKQLKIAIKASYQIIDSLNKPSLSLQKLALKTSTSAIRCKNICKDLKKKTLKKDPSLFKELPSHDENDIDYQRIAIGARPDLIERIWGNPPEEIKILALSKDPESYFKFRYPNAEMAILAVRKSGYHPSFIKRINPVLLKDFATEIMDNLTIRDLIK